MVPGAPGSPGQGLAEPWCHLGREGSLQSASLRPCLATHSSTHGPSRCWHTRAKKGVKPACRALEGKGNATAASVQHLGIVQGCQWPSLPFLVPQGHNTEDAGRRGCQHSPLLKQAHKARFTALSTKARAHLPARSSPSGARHHSLQGTREQPPQSHCSALHRNKSTAAPTCSPELHGHSHTASGPACSPHGSQLSYAETEQEMKLPSGSHCSLCRQNKGCQTETPVRASPHTLHQKPPGWVSPHVMHQKHMESLISLSVSPDQKGNLVPLQGPTGAVRGHQT